MHALTGRKQTKEHIEKRIHAIGDKLLGRKVWNAGLKTGKPAWNTVIFSPEMDSTLIDLYVNKKLHTRLVSEEMKIGRLPIMRRLKELNIRMRSVGEIRAGIKQSPETKAKRKKTNLERFGGNPWNMVVYSQERKDKMSIAAIERLSNVHPYNQGKYFSSKLNKEIFYRSSYEHKYMIELDSDTNVLWWEYEPKGCVIHYEFGGTTRRYKPDFLVINIDGTKSLVEIKGLHLMRSEKTLAKVNALGEYQKNLSNDISRCEVIVAKGRNMDVTERIVFN
jgi:hypothetical protein